MQLNPQNPTELLNVINLIHPNLKADSAHLAIIEIFEKILKSTLSIEDEDAIQYIALQMLPHITADDVNIYDEADDENEAELLTPACRRIIAILSSSF